MKKYKLKKWVENILLFMEAVIFFALIAIVEDNPFALISNKLIGTALFILIAGVLVEYGRYDKED